MKRIIALVVSILLSICMFSPVCAFAESVDFSVFSDDELVDLLAQLNEELLNRNIVKSAIVPSGIYSVGKDLPSGRYRFEMKNKEASSGPIISVKDSNGQSVYHNWIKNPEEYAILELLDGYSVEVDETVIISTFTGIMFG